MWDGRGRVNGTDLLPIVVEFQSFINSKFMAACVSVCLCVCGEGVTMCDGPAELQQAAEGERSHMGFSPAVCLLLHVLLKLDPTGRLPPLHLLVLIHDKLVQLHKHLRGRQAEFKGIVHPNNKILVSSPS